MVGRSAARGGNTLANTLEAAHVGTKNVGNHDAAVFLLVILEHGDQSTADSEAGTGIRGLADRVEAVGGRLRVWTPTGGGTRVRAQMPCG